MLIIDGDDASTVKTNSPLQFRTGSRYFFGGETAITIYFLHLLFNIVFRYPCKKYLPSAKNLSVSYKFNKYVLCVV